MSKANTTNQTNPVLDKKIISFQPGEQRLQALETLANLKDPNKNCQSSVLRDLIGVGFWILTSKYTGVPMVEQRPLPEVK